MGRRGSKINISGIKMHHFFVPELMAAAVLVKTRVFVQFDYYYYYNYVFLSYLGSLAGAFFFSWGYGN